MGPTKNFSILSGVNNSECNLKSAPYYKQIYYYSLTATVPQQIQKQEVAKNQNMCMSDMQKSSDLPRVNS